jgi:hypothetical protein
MSKLFKQEMQTATAEDCRSRWGCGQPGEFFRCGFCGHKFKVGDKWQAIYTNDMPEAGGNPLYCAGCKSGPEALRRRWAEKCREWQRKIENEFWWFNRRTKQ